jgi:Arc/MetJ-type ribon-helix-helix transcriptional regulator
MSQITVSLPDGLAAEIEKRARTAGFTSTADYLLELMRADCEQSELEKTLENRADGPFEPLEANWMDKVRSAVRRRG